MQSDYDVARDGFRLSPEAEGASGMRVAREWSWLLARPRSEAR